jgi:flagellar biosynthesis component FlhA
MLEARTGDPQELAEAARRAIVPDLLRRRGVALLEPVIFDAPFERRLADAWCRPGCEGLDPTTALRLRARIESYAATMPRDRAAVVCTSALRPVLADFLLRSEIRVNVFAYGELPNEIALAPAEVIAQEEPNALACA